MMAGFVVMPLLLLGCGSNDEGQAVEAEDATVLIAGTSSEPQAEDTLSGPIGVVGGCVGIREFVVVWPKDTEVVEKDPLTIDAPDYGEFGLEDEVAIKGEAITDARGEAARQDEYVVEGVTLPPECSEHAIWLATEG